MTSNDIQPDDFYNKIYKSYKSEDYFNETIIRINYIKNLTTNGDRAYKIRSLSLENKLTDNKSKEIETFVNLCNEKLQQKTFTEWQLFYLYKELFQRFVDDEQQGCNYFRGQSNNHDLVPGILRKTVPNSYRQAFERLYLKIAHEFPEKIAYFKLDDVRKLEEREYQLSLLQHYGLKTSLLDITRNPYIAMLFMLSGKFGEYKEPTLYLFKINEETHRNKHLFTEVKKSDFNERIVAQKGAFLNFDKIYGNRDFDREKISVIKIVLHFDEDAYSKDISIALEDLSKMLKTKSEEKVNNSDILEYQTSLEDERKNIDKSKVDCLNAIKKELSQKLREYYYFEEELFPDFEKRIQYLSDIYESTQPKKRVSV